MFAICERQHLVGRSGPSGDEHQSLGEQVTAPLVGTTRLAIAYRRYLSSMDCPTYVVEVHKSYTVSTLAMLLHRGDVELRRAAALALGMLGDDLTLEALGRALSDRDRGVRLASDDSFRSLLIRSAAPVHHQHLLRIMHLNDGDQFEDALASVTTLAKQAPMYAEAHHQMAISYRGLENFAHAQSAYIACLYRCRYHYPAWQGLAKCRLMLGDSEGAIEALQRCCKICPDMESARLQIRAIKRRLRRASD